MILLCFLLAINLFTTVEGCGKSFASAGRIVSGNEATPGAWPWQVLVVENGKDSCGGSLISPTWVLTAAHCIAKSRAYEVVLGEHDRDQSSGNEQTIDVTRTILHPNWNRAKLEFDFALLQLSRPAKMNKHVQTVCLPSAPVRVGSSCYATGWGKLSKHSEKPAKLQQVKLRVIDNRPCYETNLKGIGAKVTKNMVCGVGAGLAGTCRGDSGGPFVCSSNNKWTLHGVTSWGSPNCNSRLTNSVFARVTSARNWIKEYAGV